MCIYIIIFTEKKINISRRNEKTLESLKYIRAIFLLVVKTKTENSPSFIPPLFPSENKNAYPPRKKGKN